MMLSFFLMFAIPKCLTRIQGGAKRTHVFEMGSSQSTMSRC